MVASFNYYIILLDELSPTTAYFIISVRQGLNNCCCVSLQGLINVEICGLVERVLD